MTKHQGQAQEMFTKAVASLMCQGRKSADLMGTGCSYRKHDGAKCAIGHILTEEELETLWDYTRDLRAMRYDGIMPSRFEPHFEMLYDLQAAHDSADARNFTRSFRYRAKKVAKLYNLEMPK